MSLAELQAALATSEATLQKLLQGLTSSPQTKADAAKGIIRGPQLAIVELQLRQLRLADAASSSQPASQQTQELNGHQVLAASGSEVIKTYDRSQALAEALLGYYQQLGHMLSCAADLRYNYAYHQTHAACVFRQQPSAAHNKPDCLILVARHSTTEVGLQVFS